MADIIVCDPALTARVMRIANSAYYGLTQVVQDVTHALCIVGERELNNLVLVNSIVRSAKCTNSHMDINGYWRSSMFSAAMSSELAKHKRYDEGDLEMFFISGLLLNIGKLLLYYREPDLYEFVTQEMRSSSRTDIDIEREHLGFDHADVGAALAKSWKFSELICKSIAEHHHDITQSASMDQCITQLSATVSDQFDFNFPTQLHLDKLKPSDNGALNRMDISQKEFCIIVNNSFERYLLGYEAFCGGKN